MIRTIRRCSLFPILACVLLAACSQTSERPAPKFTGRLLLLSGDLNSGANLLELAAAADGKTYNTTTVMSGVTEATASPDQTQLLYATKDEVAVRDLQANTSKSIVKGQVFCLAWSPDGKRFSYKQRQGAATKLFVADLDGKTKVVWEDSSGIERAETRYCAQWIQPDRLVFDRFVGMIPKRSTSENLKPNTTTVATVGDSVRLVDGERKWSIQGVCASGNVLLSPADQSQPTVMAKTTDQFVKLNPTPGPSEGRFIGFAAKSCVPFFMQQSLSTSTELFSLNPTNWQRLRSAEIKQTFTPAAKALIKSSAKLMLIGDAPDKLFLIDTESGDIISLAPSQGLLTAPVPIVWIEN